RGDGGRSVGGGGLHLDGTVVSVVRPGRDRTARPVVVARSARAGSGGDRLVQEPVGAPGEGGDVLDRAVVPLVVPDLRQPAGGIPGPPDADHPAGRVLVALV